MQITPYHAKYFAFELTKRSSSDSLQKLASSLLDVQVDLNPHQVVVVNFLNKNNAADQRVHQILAEKFRLFSGVFGASDEVLGSIESGVDFEKCIAQIYYSCRTPEEKIHLGPYRFGRNIEDVNSYRIGHPLAQRIIEQCKSFHPENRSR